MRPRTYRTEAIVIKRVNVGEADKILTVVSPKYGKLVCLARGVRRLYSRKAPSLELFSQVNLFLSRGKNLDLITETTLIDGFRYLRLHLERVRFAYQFAELVNVMLQENQEQPEIYELLAKALHWLNKTKNLSEEGLRRFQRCLLTELGFGLPPKQDLVSLTAYIETLIERRLVTGPHLDTKRSIARIKRDYRH